MSSISRVHLQSLYWLSDQSFESAKLIVDCKCHNMSHLLMQYLPYQEKHYPRAEPIRKSIFEIKKIKMKIPQTKNRTSLLLTEARATRYYWSSIKLLSNQPDHWKRTYPHASDPLNQSLNIGYTMLTNIIRRSIKNYGLEPSIGSLHAPRDGKEALVYDLEELFRQPIVDAAILPIFTRRSKESNIESNEIVGAVLSRFDDQAYYHGNWRFINNILDAEIQQYLPSIRKGVVWNPYIYSWAHRTKYK